MVKVKKKTKVKKIANVLQRVTVNVQTAKPRSRNVRAYTNNGFNQFQAQNRMMIELNAMPNKIKEIISGRREETSSLMEERFQQIKAAQELMTRQITNRVEKQTMNKYLDNIASGLKVDVKNLKTGVNDIESGIPIKE
jgi:hypothetical protein